MALNLTRAFPKNEDGKVLLKVYNIDMTKIFDAFNGLENQTLALNGLTITPSANSTGTFKVNKSDGTTILSVDTSNHMVGIGVNIADYI